MANPPSAIQLLHLEEIDRNPTRYLVNADGVELGIIDAEAIADQGGPLPEVTVRGQRLSYRTLEIERTASEEHHRREWEWGLEKGFRF